jgi:hypothetical protein
MRMHKHNKEYITIRIRTLQNQTEAYKRINIMSCMQTGKVCHVYRGLLKLSKISQWNVPDAVSEGVQLVRPIRNPRVWSALRSVAVI